MRNILLNHDVVNPLFVFVYFELIKKLAAFVKQ